MISIGKHKARATEHQFGRFETGTRCVRIQFELTDGEFKGHRISWDGWFTDKTVERTLEALEYCGWDGASLAKLSGLGDREVELDIEHEENQETGRVYPRVKWVNRLGGMKLKDEQLLNGGEIQNLEREFKAEIMRLRQRSANSTAQPGNARREQRPQRHDALPYDPDFGPTDYGDDPPV